MSNKNIYLDEINHFKLEKRKLYNNIKIWKFQAKNMNERICRIKNIFKY